MAAAVCSMHAGKVSGGLASMALCRPLGVSDCKSTASTRPPITRLAGFNQLALGRPLPLVRCDANHKGRGELKTAQETIERKSPSLTGLREAIDNSTKQELTRSDIEKHQAETTSEKQSVLGAKPSSTVPWPRAEVDRRPETGDRSLMSIFAFDGAAPETINGRMAMVGFVWAMVAEKLTGLTVVEQLFHPATSGLLYFGAVVQLFTLASTIPFVNGESTDARRWGPFTARAERWNGRLAMIGFAALLIDEAIRQAPLIH